MKYYDVSEGNFTIIILQKIIDKRILMLLKTKIQ